MNALEVGVKKPELQKAIETLQVETRGEFEQLCVKWRMCPACLSRLVNKDVDLVCSGCGVVVNREPVLFTEKNLFADDHAPVNDMCIGKNLGGSLQTKGQFYVLAHGSNSLHDLPIRARQIRIISETVDHPKIMALLRYGRLLCHQWGFDDHKRTSSIIFSNYLARLLRRIGAYIALTGLRMPLSGVADVCLLLTLKKLVPEKYPDALEKLNIGEDVSNWFEELNEVLQIEFFLKKRQT